MSISSKGEVLYCSTPAILITMCFGRSSRDDYLDEPFRIVPYRRRYSSSTVIALPLSENLILNDLVQPSNCIPAPRMLDFGELRRQEQLELLQQQELARLQSIALEEERAILRAQEDALQQDAAFLQVLALEAERARLQGRAEDIILREAASYPTMMYGQGRPSQLLPPPSVMLQGQVANSPAMFNQPVIVSPPVFAVNGPPRSPVVVQQNGPQQQLIHAPLRRQGGSRNISRSLNVFIDSKRGGTRDQPNYNNSYNDNNPHMANNPIFHQHQHQKGGVIPHPTSPTKYVAKKKTGTKNVTNNYYYLQGPASNTQSHIPPQVPPSPTPSASSQVQKPTPKVLLLGPPVFPRTPPISNTPPTLYVLPPPHVSTSSSTPSPDQQPDLEHTSNPPLPTPIPSIQSKLKDSDLPLPPATGRIPPISAPPVQTKKSRLQKPRHQNTLIIPTPIQPTPPTLPQVPISPLPGRSYSPHFIQTVSGTQSVRKLQLLPPKGQFHPPSLSGSARRLQRSHLLPQGTSTESIIPTHSSFNLPPLRSLMNHQTGEHDRFHRSGCTHQRQPNSWVIDNKHDSPAVFLGIQTLYEDIILSDSRTRNTYAQLSSPRDDDDCIWYGYPIGRSHPIGNRHDWLHKEAMVSELFDHMRQVFQAIEVLQENQLCCERLTILVQQATDPITLYTISISHIIQLMKNLQEMSPIRMDSSRAYHTRLDQCISTILALVSKIPPIRRAFEIEDRSNEPRPFSDQFLLHRCSLMVQILGVMVVTNYHARISINGSERMLPNIILKGSNYYTNDKLIGTFKSEGLRSMAAVTSTNVHVLRLVSSNRRASQQIGISGRICASIEDIVDTWGGLEDIVLDGSRGLNDYVRSVAISGGNIVQVNSVNQSERETPLHEWVSGSLPSQRPSGSFSCRERILID